LKSRLTRQGSDESFTFSVRAKSPKNLDFAASVTSLRDQMPYCWPGCGKRSCHNQPPIDPRRGVRRVVAGQSGFCK
jgi:hypothetical protein